MTLRLSFKEFADEITAFSALASPLLDQSAPAVLTAYGEALRSIRDSRHFAQATWTIPSNAPLKTAVSIGQYEPSPRRGRHHVQACISSTWGITPIKPDGAKSVPVRDFLLSGVASTAIEFRDVTSDIVIALWKMEVGNIGAPGCHFHVGIGGAHAWSVFPSTLSVPRLPGLVFSAMSACEYVLNELFQDEWPKTAAKPHAKGAEQWNPIQRRRLLALLKWTHKTVMKAGRSSPWGDLKAEKPEADLFANDDDSTRLVRA